MYRYLRFASVAVLLVCATSYADDWGQWRGPQRDGVAYNSPPLIDHLPEEGLKPLWVAEIKIPSGGNGGWSSPVTANGRVYLFSHIRTQTQDQLPPEKYPGLNEEQKGKLSPEEQEEYQRNRQAEQDDRNRRYFRHDELIYCFDADTGRVLWKNERQSVRTGFPQSGTPLVAQDRLYILGAGLTARCVDAQTGEDLWATRLPGKFGEEHLHSSFALAEGVAVVLANQLYGVDAQSGEFRWQSDEGTIRGQYTSPVVWRHAGRELVLVNSGGQTVCVDPQSGEEQWRVESEAQHSTPVVAGNRLVTYGSSRKGGLRCFDLTREPPELLWNYQGVADPGSSPVVCQGKIFAQGERRLACVDLQTGKADWTARLDLGQPRYTSLAAGDGRVFYTFEGVLCFSAAADDFEPLFNGKIDNNGLLAEEASFRRLLKIDELKKTPEGQKEAEQLWRKTFAEYRPLACSSPALADGKLYLRTRQGVACYDLRVK